MVDTLAMRCWPEVILDEFYGIAVCSTMGHLTNHGHLCACEGDVYGAVMMRIGQELSGDKPFFCDLIVCEGDYGVTWHCGAAPCAICKPGFKPELRCSATIEGGGVKGVTDEFPLKPGRVTLARLGEKRDGDGYRMLVCTGEGLDTDLFVRGNPLKVKFDAGCDAVRKEVIENGWEHHYALMYGDHADELADLCRNMGIELHLVK
jgi:L-fucose isomerase-like protein